MSNRHAVGAAVSRGAFGSLRATTRAACSDDLLRRVDSGEAEIVRLRGLAVRHVTELALLREELERLHVETPGSRGRLELVRENRGRIEGLFVMRRALAVGG